MILPNGGELRIFVGKPPAKASDPLPPGTREITPHYAAPILPDIDAAIEKVRARLHAQIDMRARMARVNAITEAATRLELAFRNARIAADEHGRVFKRLCETVSEIARDSGGIWA